METVTIDKKNEKSKEPASKPPLEVLELAYKDQSESPATTATSVTVIPDAVPPNTELALQVGSMYSRLRELEARLDLHVNAEPVASLTAPTSTGLAVTMVGGIFNCPECGLRFNAPALITTKSGNAGFYEHSFDESPKLAGKKCRLSGIKFKSPVVFLEFVNPEQNLTAGQ